MIIKLLLPVRLLRGLLPVLLLGGSLMASLPVLAWSQGDQKVTLAFKEVPLSHVFKGIEKQTGLVFMYNTNQVKDNYRVSIYVKKEPLEDVLKQLLTPKGISWEFRMKTVVLKPEKPVVSISSVPADSAGNIVIGEVRDQNGVPLPGAFIIVKSTQKGTVSNEKGRFSLRNVPVGAMLQISYTGFTSKLIPASNTPIQVKLSVADNRLDETVVMAYGTTSRRLNTGSIGKVTAEEISRQPVSNPLATLEGRVPGVLITQSSGVPGASFKVQVRGQSSLINGSEPLYIVDGIPFAANNNNINSMASILSQGSAGLSPFSMLNPADIESIEVLKDADATAIYGSRGANGVVLITTRHPKAGKTALNANVNTGFSTVTRMPQMLNTQQYVAMRMEAFRNDSITPNATPGTRGYAPDLTLWDTTRYTDVKKLLYGGTAKVWNAGLSLTGGNERTQFLIGGTWHRESTVMPTDAADNNSSVKVNVNHISNDRRLNISFTSIANFDNNQLPAITALNLLIPPNFPEIYDSTGRLNWTKNGVLFKNPIADFQASYKAITNNFLNNLSVGYQILDGLTIRTSAGFNIMNIKETRLVPIAFYSPTTNPTGSASFSNSSFKSWIIEPQIEYTRSLFRGKIDALLGGTWQSNQKDNMSINLSGYTSDNLLNSIDAGPNVSSKSSDNSLYKYQAVFARINYLYANKYILNLTGRRDGSSRFGPGNRFSNFGAVGLGWIFTNESFFSHNVNILSYGKLRGSYGVTGNDQIGDYKYLPTWTTTIGIPYQNGVSLRPDNLFNPGFNWERNKKLELAAELGFLRDKILFSAAFYQNSSDNQLVNYKLPSQTGFSTMVRNLPALIVNKGVEIELNYKAINTKDIKWNISSNITFANNKLVKYPDLQSSPYANIYELGASVNVVKLLKYTGIDPKTGLYTFDDVNKDNLFNVKDYQNIGKTDPEYFGGIASDFSYKGFQLNVFFSFRKQFGKNIEQAMFMSQYFPGLQYNQPAIVLDRWQQSGDNAAFQKLTATTTSAAYKQQPLFAQSSGLYGDASFIRLKNICLSYSFPENYLKHIGLKSGKIYIQGQNLFTITGYEGDPETQNLLGVPPLKTIAGGIQIGL